MMLTGKHLSRMPNPRTQISQLLTHQHKNHHKGDSTFVVVCVVVWPELEFHARVIAGHKRLNDNRRSQIALKQLG